MAHTPKPRFLFNDGTIHPDSDGYRLLPNRPLGRNMFPPDSKGRGHFRTSRPAKPPWTGLIARPHMDREVLRQSLTAGPTQYRPFGLGGKAAGKLRLNDLLDC
jgi:hypothetical protein